MPKIIKNLEPQIKSIALKLYESLGYKDVSMRAIAGELGIAVGTLYNYYPNKEVLFLSALEESWIKTMDSIDSHLKASQDPKERLLILITTLYDDISARKGLGKELLINNAENVSSLSHIFTSLQNRLVDVIHHYNSDGYAERKAYTLIMSLANIMQKYPDEREENIKYFMSIM